MAPELEGGAYFAPPDSSGSPPSPALPRKGGKGAGWTHAGLLEVGLGLGLLGHGDGPLLAPGTPETELQSGRENQESHKNTDKPLPHRFGDGSAPPS